MRTYEHIQLVAAELVGYADLHADKDLAISMCLQAGFLRGLVYAGEPVDSNLMNLEVQWAEQLLHKHGVVVSGVSD